MLYLGTETYIEGSQAAGHFSNWVRDNVINDERTKELWSEQVHNGKTMIASAIRKVEGNYNETMWFTPVKSLITMYYASETSNSTAVINSASASNALSLHKNITIGEVL